MKLNTIERIVLLSSLPREGNIGTLRTLRRLRERLDLTAQETKETGLKVTPEGAVMMNQLAGQTLVKDLRLEQAEIELIKTELRKLNDRNRLTENHISLWEKFVEERDTGRRGQKHKK